MCRFIVGIVYLPVDPCASFTLFLQGCLIGVVAIVRLPQYLGIACACVLQDIGNTVTPSLIG